MVTALINKMSITDKLPEKPSELIRLALHDLELCEQDNRYFIDMENWHTPYGESISSLLRNKCLVCLTGSVMAKSLNADVLEHLRPYNYKDKTKTKLLAIDEFRIGYVYQGIASLFPESFKHMKFNNLSGYRDIINYRKNPAKFKQQMHQLADDLEREGL